jgi:hypothetical protein|tara:strand:+ start:167 stop:352 length:186 start_codon:yes stop_codon:yes gene_type:complete
MRNDYGTRPYISRFSGKTAKSKPKKQNANDRLDESLGMRDGKESTKSQSYKDRRDESRASK